MTGHKGRQNDRAGFIDATEIGPAKRAGESVDGRQNTHQGDFTPYLPQHGRKIPIIARS
ncbi:MAG: hypothetical protein ACE10C_00570 [Candidatus Binatia bacterium]